MGDDLLDRLGDASGREGRLGLACGGRARATRPVTRAGRCVGSR